MLELRIIVEGLIGELCGPRIPNHFGADQGLYVPRQIISGKVRRAIMQKYEVY